MIHFHVHRFKFIDFMAIELRWFKEKKMNITKYGIYFLAFERSELDRKYAPIVRIWCACTDGYVGIINGMCGMLQHLSATSCTTGPWSFSGSFWDRFSSSLMTHSACLLTRSRNPGTSRQPSCTNVSREEFDRLFSDMKGQISSMKRDLAKERDEANAQLLKRLKLEKKTVFRL